MMPDILSPSCCMLHPLGNATRNMDSHLAPPARNSVATPSLKALASKVLARNKPRNSCATGLLQEVVQPDPFDHDAFAERVAIIEANGVPREWAEGFATLCTMPCPPTMPPQRWQQIVDDGGRFLDRWGRQAAVLGWRAVEVFGVHPAAPLRRYDGMGLVPLLQGHEVVALTASMARIHITDTVTQSFSRHTLAREAVAIWQLEVTA